jgi:hypothetical protein
MRVAISQSNYIPWKGYFELISQVDVFVLLDNVQFTKRDWRNRNLVKSPDGEVWLTIPVESKGNYQAKISEMRVSRSDWKTKHLRTIEMNYSRAAEFDSMFPWIKSLYEECPDDLLVEVNRHFILQIMGFLDINTRIVGDEEFDLKSDPSIRLLDICREIGATEYVSGPAAKNYLNTEAFRRQKIDVEWFSYGPYSKYEQPWGDFIDSVSVLDTILCAGTSAHDLMRSASN